MTSDVVFHFVPIYISAFNDRDEIIEINRLWSGLKSIYKKAIVRVRLSDRKPIITYLFVVHKYTQFQQKCSMGSS